MKTSIKILAALVVVIASFTFTSCKQIKDLADIEFGTEITTKIPVHFDANVDKESIDLFKVLSLDNSDTHDYLSHFEDVSIKKMTFKIVEFKGDDSSAAITSVDFYADNVELLSNLEFNIYEAYTNQTIFEVVDVAKINQIANLLKNNKNLTIRLTGDYSSVKVTDFNVEVTAELNIIANPL